jgi:hypothetical protein
MKTDLTDITLVVDRSGSMEAVREDAEGGVNAFLREQAQQPGEALLTLVQFDTEYEFVHKGISVKDAPAYKLVPRGCTALLDAVGRAINETGDRLAKMAETDRPGLVVFVIVTDGLENSSHEFTKVKVQEMIDRQQNQYHWQFTFPGRRPGRLRRVRRDWHRPGRCGEHRREEGPGCNGRGLQEGRPDEDATPHRAVGQQRVHRGGTQGDKLTLARDALPRPAGRRNLP